MGAAQQKPRAGKGTALHGLLPGEGRAGAAAGCRLAHAQGPGQQQPQSAPHSGFGCTEQALRAGTVLGGVSGPAGHGFCVPGSLPGRSGCARGALCALPGSGWDVPWSQPALNGDTGTAAQPDLEHKAPPEPQSSPRRRRQCLGARFGFGQPGALAGPGGLRGTRSCPSPAHQASVPGCVRATVPPSRPGGAVNVTMPCNAATGATCQ